ncbi:glycosyltransferase [Humisphaera borealis]|uniref:Glycosyltransferase n=1 Tax=Humisphaera borealis TaxID=2807512 RepID=A0A7M2WRV5_9BACT|nr:glycosyltransferase [Humisphaera borealis]QOV88275.1 glycosyltransferase [Humisphaera borealis]
MTVVTTGPVLRTEPTSGTTMVRQSDVTTGRKRVIEAPANRVRRDGKFFRLGEEKFYVKGVTYGPFAPDANGSHFANRAQTRKDFEQILELGGNCVRIYYVPPSWFLELAREMGIKIFLDVSWPKNLAFVDDPEVAEQARAAVRDCARRCGNHPAVMAISVVNEIPPELVRFMTAARVEAFIDELVAIVKEEAPHCLATFANFPTTEYLRPRAIDFCCFNVYLDYEPQLRNYLARLQMIAGELPLMLGEYGVDTHQSYSEEQQATMLSTQLKATFDEGAVGTFVFSYTDDWYVHNWQIEDWKFGVTRRERDDDGYRIKKPSFAAVQDVFRRAPQVTDLKLPKCSVIICSYNGASTVESCVASMGKIRYHLPDGTPNYEVVFVDDGSKDNTQEILAKFKDCPWLVNIKQKNMGLSYARNVGAQAATGEIIVYTDSDCEADEDWLYFVALAMVRSNHVGMGGPNLIPDEGSWVADCVGLSPGGPTHVMINDREAEHVPGCNMSFYKYAWEQVNGFDPQYRAAGDDVDFIWRLQHLGYSIGFSPAAQVWHYRRNTVQAYLKQQRGYGIAEALLKYKHPDHFNTLGASHWRGRIYGGEEIGIKVGGDVIYHGLFGTGLFQTIYRKPASMIAMMLMSIEWHLLTGFMAILGLAFGPLLWVALWMFLTPIVLACIAAYQAPRPRHAHRFSKPLIAYLHYRQPIVRGWARYSVRLKSKVMDAQARGYKRRNELPFDLYDRDTLKYWSKEHGRLKLMDEVIAEIRKKGWRVRVDSGWEGWDLEIYGSRYTKIRITTATEDHHGVGKLTRVRVHPMMSTFCTVLLWASCILGGLLLLQDYLWPFSRTAALIPVAWWTMYLVNRWRVTVPVLGMIDEVAERSGYWPVYPKKPEKPSIETGVPQPVRKKESQREDDKVHLPEDAVVA